ncbi:MAG: hypothetical protein ABGX49_01945 [Candidatus Poseidoniia archaeon]
MIELDIGVLGPSQYFGDGSRSGLRVEIPETVAALGVEADIFEGIGTGEIHFDYDGAKPSIGAQDSTHHHRLVEVAGSKLKEPFLALWKDVSELPNLDPILVSDHQLGIRDTENFVGEGNFVLENFGEINNLPHDLKVPGTELGFGSFVEDVGNFV